MKLVDLFKQAHANLWHNRLRSFFTFVAVFTGACSLCLTTGIRSGVADYTSRQIAGLGGSNRLDIRLDYQKNAAIPTDDPVKYEPPEAQAQNSKARKIRILKSDLEKVRALPGIIEAEPDFFVRVIYVGRRDAKFEMRVEKWDPAANANLRAGSPPDNQSKEYQVVLPSKFASALGFERGQDAVGQTVVLGVAAILGKVVEIPVKVVGVSSRSLLSTFAGPQPAPVNRSLLNEIYETNRRGMPEVYRQIYSGITARYSPSLTKSELESLKTKISNLGLSASTPLDQLGSFKEFIELTNKVLVWVSVIALIASVISVLNTQVAAVNERTKDIGLMKALGMRSSRVFLLVSLESGLFGFWGSFVGCLVGIGIGALGSQWAVEGPLKKLDGIHPYIAQPLALLGIVATITLLSAVSGALPSARAASLNPITSLRYE